MNILRPSKRRDALKLYLRGVVQNEYTVLGYSADAAEWHAEQRATLKRKGKTPAFVDGQIASIAAVNSLVLVTNNVRDFKNFKGLTVENWM